MYHFGKVRHRQIRIRDFFVPLTPRMCAASHVWGIAYIILTVLAQALIYDCICGICAS